MTLGKGRRSWKQLFLDTLRGTGNVRLSARNANVTRQVVYRARDRSAKFRADWDEALEEARELLEAEARRRAAIGVDEPVFYKGEVVGHIRKYSDTLLMFLLKAHWPEKFRENVSIDQRVSGRDGGPVKDSACLPAHAGNCGRRCYRSGSSTRGYEMVTQTKKPPSDSI